MKSTLGRTNLLKPSLIMGFILVAFSCSTPRLRPTPVPETFDAAAYLTQGRNALNHPTDSAFLALVNNHHESFKNETRTLFDLFIKKQKSLFSYFKAKGDYSQARHYLNNLAAFTDISSEETTRFYTQFINELVKRNEICTAQFLAQKLKPPLMIPSLERATPTDISEYNTILAEISVQIYSREMNSVPRVTRVFGTGFLVSPTHLLTAYHVVEPVINGRSIEGTITVKIQERVLEDVAVAAYDALTDVALLDLKEPLSFPLKAWSMFGDSTKLKQGFPVYCLAHHRGFTSTLTRGIVSAVRRKAPEVGTWVQIDANVAPGASGGLLIGEDLKIYGMVVAGLLFEDINFAVPSVSICEVLDRLKTGAPPRRPWLGLLLEQPRFKKWDPKIIEVFPSSPMKQLEVDNEAVLLEINHRRVRTIDEAQETVNSFEAGNIVHVKIENMAGLVKEYWITLERRPEFAIYNATRQYSQLSSLYPHFGVKVDAQSLNTETVTINFKTVHLNFYTVLAVRDDSVLADRGVRSGDFIGIIDDSYEDKDRYLDVLHLPKIEPLKKSVITDFIYRLKKSKYDENIL